MIDILDHILRVNSRIYLQYRDKPNLTSWLHINAEIANIFEPMFSDVYCLLDIDLNSGVQLDLIGRLIGQPRLILSGSLVSDVTYRVLLKSRIAKNTSDCTFDSIIDLMSFVTDLQVNGITDPEDMTFAISFGQAVPAEIQDLLNNADIVPKPQGVRFTGWTVNIGDPLEVSIPVTLGSNCDFSSPDVGCSSKVDIPSTVTGGDGSYTYLWSKVGGLGSIDNGQGTDMVTIATISGNSGIGTYELQVTDGLGSIVTSNVCTITFTQTELFDPLVVNLADTASDTCNFDPDAVDGCVAQVTPTAAPTGGDGSYSYQWTKISGIGTIVSGDTTATATIENAVEEAGPAPGATGVFRCTVTDGQPVVSFEDITVTFIEAPDAFALNLTNKTTTSSTIGAGDLEAVYGLRNNGTSFRQSIVGGSPGSENDVFEEWANNNTDPDIGDLYEVFATDAAVTGSGTKVGTYGSWVPMSSDLEWSLLYTDAGIGTSEVDVVFSIGLLGTSTALETATITFFTERAS